MKSLKKILKWTGIILLLIIVGLWITIELRQNRQFTAPFPQLAATNDSALIVRGKHLVFGPAHCATCHTPPEMEARVRKGETVALTGGYTFQIPLGKLYSTNLTPDASGIKNIPDSVIARALRYGISSKGKALFDFMPFHNTSDSDIVAILSYLRHQPAQKQEVPRNNLNLLGKFVNAFFLKPVGPEGDVPHAVKPDTTVQYGKYLAYYVTNCRGCHTNRDLMTGAYTGEEFAGGFPMENITDSGTYILTTPNLTPDATGKLKGWTEADFIKRFRAGRAIPQSHMPWESFGRMTDDELKAIYRFLQTVKPVKNVIEQPLQINK